MGGGDRNVIRNSACSNTKPSWIILYVCVFIDILLQRTIVEPSTINKLVWVYFDLIINLTSNTNLTSLLKIIHFKIQNN